MGNESSHDDRIRELWRSQHTKGFSMSIDQIRANATKLQRNVKWRNTGEYVGAFVAVVLFAFQFWRSEDPLARVGCGLIIAGVLYIAWHLHSRGSWRQLPEDMGLSSSVEFQRRELERQRNLLQGVWRWYIAPMIPGLAVLIAAGWRKTPKHEFITLFAIAAAAFFVIIAKLNARVARRLQNRIDELDELTR
jgi:hypothetical protein